MLLEWTQKNCFELIAITMAKRDINKAEFTEETKLKLDLFRECYREWFPVFVHNPYIKHIYVYDMFAGSGMDSAGNPGSPIILFQESRGNQKQHCESLRKSGAPKVTFAFNEYEESKKRELEENVSKEFKQCKSQCAESVCPFENRFFYEQEDFSELVNNNKPFNAILSNKNYAKFILLDQYGFKQINDDVFLKLVDSPSTDFIFFIASSFIKRFKEMDAVKNYFNTHKINFDDTKPKECHRVITNYYRSLIPSDKEYYLHSFTIRKGTNYYGLIFGTNHSLGMEKFVKVCWRHDSQAGESNCNIYNDFEKGSLFYDVENTAKKVRVQTDVESKIMQSEISDNVTGLKYTLKNGCEPKLFVEVVKKLVNQNKILIKGKFNTQATNIHKVDEYKITVI